MTQVWTKSCALNQPSLNESQNPRRATLGRQRFAMSLKRALFAYFVSRSAFVLVVVAACNHCTDSSSGRNHRIAEASVAPSK